MARARHEVQAGSGAIGEGMGPSLAEEVNEETPSDAEYIVETLRKQGAR